LMELKSSKSQKRAADTNQTASVIEKGVLSRNQVVTRTINRPVQERKRPKLSKTNLNALLISEDQQMKDDAEQWLKLCYAFVCFPVIIDPNHDYACGVVALGF
jgi:hypothetical protein